jgi:hypothetical protein
MIGRFPTMRPRTAALALAVLALSPFTQAGCDKAQNPLAPASTVLTLTAVPTQISISGQGSRITVIGVKPDGNPINPGTQITLITSLGVLRPPGVACTNPAVVDIVEADGSGRATAQLCGDGRVGDAEVTATLTNVSGGGEGGGTATVTVRIGETDASKPTVLVNANPSVVPVGGESVITLIGRAADGTPVPAGSRIRLTVDLGSLRCASRYACPGESSNPCNAACTDAQGEAEATFIAGDRSGNGEVTAILGTSDPAMVTIDINAAIDSLTLNVNPTSVARTSAGAAVTLTATLIDTLGTPLSGVLVQFNAARGTLNNSSATSNAQGIATVTLTVRDVDVQDIPANGTFPVQASATSEGQTRSDTRQITVLGTP